MIVGDLVKRPPLTIHPDATIFEVSTVMARERVGLLVVVDRADPNRLLGVVSERDIIRAISRGASPSEKIEGIYTRSPVVVRSSASLAEAAKTMVEHNVRHLVVVDEWGRLIGVISIRDLIGEVRALRELAKQYGYYYPPVRE